MWTSSSLLRDPRRCFWLIVATCAWVGCNDADRQRDEARAFLALNQSIRYEQAPAERRAALSKLASLPLVNEDVKRVRDSCVSGHEALLAEESAQRANADAIESALEDNPGDGPLPEEALAELKTKLTASEHALDVARDKLRECETSARQLELRFGRR